MMNYAVLLGLVKSVLRRVSPETSSDGHDLEAGYRDMAADHQREAEAIEWVEGVSDQMGEVRSGGSGLAHL